MSHAAAKTLRILGTRGIPAAHGGFETFAERLALYLVRRGWKVVVYCQAEGRGTVHEDRWENVVRIHVPVDVTGAAGTVLFDWRATLHAARHRDLCLTLGYNTAVFCAMLRARGVKNVINMDGVEWRRDKWGAVAKVWFWLNDWAGCWLGNALVADNPGIADHLGTRGVARKVAMIPYGADKLEGPPTAPLGPWNLTPGRYWMLVARPEPENSILEVVRAFSRQRRGLPLLVLGRYTPDSNGYHQSVMAAASDEVIFAGAIYDAPVVQALRLHAQGYLHGHRVGGTNPSLVEAMGAGNPVIAHDNVYNRWVAGEGALYFADEHGCAQALEQVLAQPGLREGMAQRIRERYAQHFTWTQVLGEYERLLERWLPAPAASDVR